LNTSHYFHHHHFNLSHHHLLLGVYFQQIFWLLALFAHSVIITELARVILLNCKSDHDNLLLRMCQKFEVTPILLRIKNSLCNGLQHLLCSAFYSLSFCPCFFLLSSLLIVLQTHDSFLFTELQRLRVFALAISFAKVAFSQNRHIVESFKSFELWLKYHLCNEACSNHPS
jgi:hypothetical protein